MIDSMIERIPLDLIPVTDLKQWAYCERIVYYHRVMPAVGKPTFKMREAIAAQDLVESLEMRRGLHHYRLENARRHFNIWLSDPTLGLSGKTDLILESQDQVAVVDFKLTSGEVGNNHRMQLTGYSMLAELAYGKPSPVAFLYRIPDNAVFPIEITPDMRAALVTANQSIRHMAETEAFPPPTSVRGRCVECEYANYCGDIW
jgi:CRISPR-associated exonuclease Cas4